jgi:hypothetical protein
MIGWALGASIEKASKNAMMPAMNTRIKNV